MVWKSFDVEKDKKFQEFATRQMSEGSKKRFISTLGNYAKFNEMSLEELIDEAIQEEMEQIPLKWRKLYSRMLNFRTYLINEKNFAKNTVDTNLTSIRTFYNECRVELPQLPRINDKEYQKGIHLEYEELPDLEYARTVMKGKGKIKHKALVAVAYSNGLLRTDLSRLIFKQIADGLQDYTTIPIKTAQDIINIFDGKTENFKLNDEEVKVICVLKCERAKTKEEFYAPLTPEALQWIIDWLKQRPNMQGEDSLFELKPSGVGRAFELQNERYNWGKSRDGENVFITRHIRSWVSSTIEDTIFADYIEGRKVNRIREAYYRRPRSFVRENYEKHLHKLGILVDYNEKKLSKELDDMTKKYNDMSKKYNELLNQNTSTNTRLETIEKTQKEIENKINTEYTYRDISDIVRKYAMRNNKQLSAVLKDKFDFKLVPHAIELAKKDNKKNKFSNTKEYLTKLYIRANNHKAFNPTFIENKNQEAIDKIEYSKEIYEIFIPMISECHNFMEKNRIQLDQSQEKELNNHLKSYAQYLYNNNEEKNEEYIQGLLRAIALDELDEIELI